MAKRILVTGATDGIGKQTALELARVGHEVILHGRNKDKAMATWEEMLSGEPALKLKIAVADFSSLENIKELSRELHNSFDQIDVLINNAAVYMNEYEQSEDGYEMTFAVNHLATFALTLQILDLIESPGGRIINVASMAHGSSPPLELQGVNTQDDFDPYLAYARSKLCNILFSNELATRLQNSKITSNSLHPGVINTKLLRAGFGMGGAPVAKGAETPVYLAVSDEVRNINGEYFVNKQVSSPSAIATDKEMQTELWEYSEKLTGIKM